MSWGEGFEAVTTMTVRAVFATLAAFGAKELGAPDVGAAIVGVMVMVFLVVVERQR